MLIIGVTGPSGAGKSVFCSFLAEAGCAILDCDAIYHELTDSPSACTSELADEKNFGPAVLRPDGSLDRKKLAALVFADGADDRLLLLNKISHRHVTLRVTAILRNLRRRKNPPRAAIIDAPLLIQAGMKKRCDLTVALLADRKLRFGRLCERDRIDGDALDARLNAAPEDSFYTENCDLTVINEGDMESLKEKALRLLSDAEAENEKK